MKKFSILVFVLIAIVGCGKTDVKEKKESIPIPEILQTHCSEIIGEPRIEKISEHVWLAIGYDLASVVLVHTPGGENIIIDTAMSPKRASEIKNALLSQAPQGSVKTIIYTHSHIDHIGGASIFKDTNTQIWATDAFIDNLFKQYAMFVPIETIRGRRQFGDHVSLNDLPCSSIGKKADISASLESGVLLPTYTFSGTKTLTIDGLEIELIEAHGETPDHLIVWVPEDKTLIAGDDFYWTFPNLYTIRGTSARPVDQWIASIDAMRRKDAEHLIPMHTKPIHGKKQIAEILTNYRDAIQWVRDETVRGANLGKDLNTLAEEIKLPAHLTAYRYTKELYGQVGWSVKGIYTSNLGWFDGRPDTLYPLPKSDIASREITLLGGTEKIMDMAQDALKDDDVKWAVHLLTKLKDSKLAKGDQEKKLIQILAESYEKLAYQTCNTNGRAYLLESAYELKKGISLPEQPKLQEEVVANIPLEKIFAIMATRLITEQAMDVHESVQYIFPKENKKFVITVRRGVAEIVEGDPLPGTPDPVAIVTFDVLAFRKTTVKQMSPAAAFASGKVKVQGSWVAYLKFMKRFDRG